MDSGYNTTSAGTASLIDGLSSDCQSKESFSSNLAEEAFTRHTKIKVILNILNTCMKSTVGSDFYIKMARGKDQSDSKRASLSESSAGCCLND